MNESNNNNIDNMYNNNNTILYGRQEEIMLTSCSYCGRIHDSKYKCTERLNSKNKTITEVDKFRWTSLWQKKREEIKKRDLYLCQICIRELYNTVTKYNTDELSVHHNIPINKDYNKRLNNNNLLTVCNYHHEMCESGEITQDEVQIIIDEQEKINIASKI